MFFLIYTNMSSLKKESTCLDWGWREGDSGKAMLISQYITWYSSHQNWANTGLLTRRHHPVRLVASSSNGLYSSVPSPNKIVWNIYYKCSGKSEKNMDILCWGSLRRFCRGEACRSPIRDTVSALRGKHRMVVVLGDVMDRTGCVFSGKGFGRDPCPSLPGWLRSPGREITS